MKNLLRGPPLDIWVGGGVGGGGGGGIFAWSIFIYFTREIENCIFSPQDRLGILISLFILYLFQPPL